MKTVLIVDDDTLVTRFYVQALQNQKFNVIHITSPDEAMEVVIDKSREFHLFIVDIMMPPGKRYASDDTKEGLTTGLLLYRDLRAARPGVPTIILTNVRDWESPPFSTVRLNLSPAPEKIMNKLDFPPSKLVSIAISLTSAPILSENPTS